jgi:tyrosine decarboxylase / aspartate 1-decarboxylase
VDSRARGSLALGSQLVLRSFILSDMPHDAALDLLAKALGRLQQDFASLPGLPGPTPESVEKMTSVLDHVAGRMADNYPYFHPLYAGQMLKPPHPIARAAYAVSMWLNPNNHALDGGRASSQMEIEAVREIAGMFGWTSYLGHLTSGGTFANLEALWVAGQLAPGMRIVASEQAHYTHARISAVLKIGFGAVATDVYGRMDMTALEEQLKKGDVGTVVVTLGTTASGSVDPLHLVLELQKRYGFRIHVDAAYGGYFRLIAPSLDSDAREALEAINRADSIVVDPHKHGLQPYGCGCILFQDPAVGRFYKHDSPYTYFTSKELHLGEISLECSRAGASAVALWATQQLLPLVPEGEFAAGLAQSRAAAKRLYDFLQQDRRFIPSFPPELDIVVWAVKALSCEDSGSRAQAIFHQAAQLDLHLALVKVQVTFFPMGTWANIDATKETMVTCLRSVLMKPEHLAWIETILQKLDQATEESH